MPRLHPIQVVSTCIRIQVARPGYLYPATCIWCKRGLRVMMLSRTSDTTAVGVVILFVSVGVFVVVEMLTDDQLWTRRTRPVATGLSDSAHMRRSLTEDARSTDEVGGCRRTRPVAGPIHQVAGLAGTSSTWHFIRCEKFQRGRSVRRTTHTDHIGTDVTHY